jgi:hypothetical protein
MSNYKITKVMKRLITISLLILTLISCIGQTKKTESQKDGNSPNTSINVKKIYDKNGNVVQYDSSYSSFYSSIKGNPHLRDSIFNNFRNDFNDKYFFSNEPFFKNFFFDDSAMNKDFFRNDFFFKHFRSDMARMDSLFQGMDSVKNDFFNKHLKPNVIK